jgi:hypothetical protein
LFFLALCIVQIAAQTLSAQSLDSIERGRMIDMLNNIKSEIKKSYYYQGFHGVNLDERFQKAEEKLKQAASLGQAFGIIAQAVMDLNDSHTVFLPLARAARAEYGWQMQMLGVVPDKLMVPSALDLASGSDPVLSHALELAGAAVTPEQAGKFFPVE